MLTLSGTLPSEYVLTESDLAAFCATTPDADSLSVIDKLERVGESPESHINARKAWMTVGEDLVDQLSGQDPTPLGEWISKGVDLSWTGRNLNTITVSRHFLEAQLNNLMQAKSDLIAHYQRSLRIRLDMERAFHAASRFRGIQKDHSQLVDMFHSQASPREGEGQSF